MKFRRTLLVLSSLIACGDSDSDASASATVVDASESLTTDAEDVLFELRVSDLSDPLATSEVLLTVAESGATATAMSFELEDADGDGLLGSGDTLVGVEPVVNVFDESHVGMTFDVELLRETGGNTVETVWAGTWTAG